MGGWLFSSDIRINKKSPSPQKLIYFGEALLWRLLINLSFIHSCCSAITVFWLSVFCNMITRKKQINISVGTESSNIFFSQFSVKHNYKHNVFKCFKDLIYLQENLDYMAFNYRIALYTMKY